MLFQRLRWAILGLINLLAIGTLGYKLIEGWSWFDSLWMVFITLTTIGYSEVHTLSPWGRTFTIGYMTLGLGLVTYGFSQIARYVVEGGLRHDLIERRRRFRMERLDKHVIVVGYGRLGREVVDDLVHRGKEVAIVDTSPDLFDEIPQQCVLITGDGTHDEVLKHAGIERAAGIAIATPHSATNVYVTLAARQLNPNIAIITRVDDRDAYDKARRAGADRLVAPFDVGASRMAQALLHPESSDFVEQVITRHHQGLDLQDVPVSALATNWHGSLRDLDVRGRASVLVVAIRRADGTLVAMPDPDVHVAGGDVLVVVGKPKDVASFQDKVG